MRAVKAAFDPEPARSRSAVSTRDQIILKTAERRSLGNVGLTETESSRAAGQSPSRPERRNARPVVTSSIPHREETYEQT